MPDVNTVTIQLGPATGGRDERVNHIEWRLGVRAQARAQARRAKAQPT